MALPTGAIGSSTPQVMIEGVGAAQFPRLWAVTTTEVSSAIIATGYWKGMGAGSRGTAGIGMRVGDLLMHYSSTDSAKPGVATLHGVLASTLNVASTVLSSGYNAAYDITLATAT